MCLSLNSIVLEWPSRFHEPGVRFQVCPWNAAVQASRKTRIFTFSSLLSLSPPSPFSLLHSRNLVSQCAYRPTRFAFRRRDSFSVRRSLLWASDYTPSCAFNRSSFLCRCSVYDTDRDRRPLISKAGDKVYSATTTVGKWSTRWVCCVDDWELVSRCVSCSDEEYTEDIPRLVGYGNVEASINSIKS